MAKITTVLNLETQMKLARRAQRAGLSPEEAFKIIATKGVEFFLALLVGATKS